MANDPLAVIDDDVRRRDGIVNLEMDPLCREVDRFVIIVLDFGRRAFLGHVEVVFVCSLHSQV